MAHVYLRQPLYLSGEVKLPSGMRAGNNGADDRRHAFETAQVSTAAAIAGDLPIIKSVRADPAETAEQRQMASLY